jgi:hypothetical protein
MKILRAKEDFGSVKKGDRVIVLPEHRAILTTYVCFPFFIIPRLFTIELIGVLLETDCANVDDNYDLADIRLLEGVEKV